MVFLGYGGNQGGGSWGGGGDYGKGGGKGGWGGQSQPDVMDVMYAMQVMQAMGVPAAMGGGKKGKGKGGKGGKGKKQQFGGKKKKGASSDLPWKSRLNNAYSKEHKIPVPKDSIVYTTLESDEKKFMCTLTCDKFSNEYTTEEVFETKKEAEEAVAEAALKGEFAEIYEAGPAPPKKKQAQAPPKKKKQAQAPPAKKQKTVQADLPWKSRIVNAYSQEHKTCTTKDTFTYTTLQSEGGSYMSTLTCEKFSAEYTSDELYESKKIAEEAVAMAALKGEFPAAYATVPAAMKKAGAKGGARAKGAVKKFAAGVKRKVANADAPQDLASDAKSRINNCCMVLAERAMTKADIVYDVTESNGNSVATLTLNCFEGKKPVFKSKPAAGTSKDSKKQAQNDAAEKALQAYKAELDEKMPEHEAKKAAKKAEFEAKVAAKKAAEA